jgi:hypothetical protein
MELSMKRNIAFLAVSVVAFIAWIGWLGSHALRHKNPVVVSHAQLLVSQVDVVAHIENLQEKRVRVDDVLYPGGGGPAKGSEIFVRNLPDAKGFTSAGSYVLPLIVQKDEYLLAGLPEDPGFPGHVDPRSVSPRIYPYTAEVRKQLAAIHQEKGR